MGHATRCIPVIKTLQKLGCKVTVACDGARLLLLQKEFPEVEFLLLKGYQITYTNNKRLLPFKILLQSPKILQNIKRERIWLNRIIEEKQIDAVISDNRFGFYTKKIPCIFITHQLQIQAPFTWLRRWIQIINYRYINRFTACWVPDLEGKTNVAAALSHPAVLPATPVKYLGILSRFERNNTAEKKYDWLILLSGPEPQRTALEDKLMQVIPKIKGKVLFARGKPGDNAAEQIIGNCTIVNHFSGVDMQKAFEEAEFILSRSGYTTVMELLSMHKKALLIPTPGQTEQEYLAAHLMKQHWCYSCNQDDDLLPHLQKAVEFYYQLPQLGPGNLEAVISSFIEQHL